MSYTETLAAVGACFAMKMAVNHVLAMRSILAGNDVRKANNPESAESFMLKDVFKWLLLVPVTQAGTDPVTSVKIADSYRNATENEPFFFMVATAYGQVVANPSTTLLKIYCASRIAHWVMHIFVRKQPWRGLAFLPSVFIPLYMAAEVLLAKGSLLISGA